MSAFGENLEQISPVSDAPAPPDMQTPADDAAKPVAAPAAPPVGVGGLSPTYNATVGQLESSGGKSYGNGGGIYQFMPGTAKAYGYTQDQIRGMSPEDQGKLNDRLTADNVKVLTARGVPVNDFSAYVAHQQGAGGAAKLFKADPNASAVDTVGKAAANGNKPFFYNEDGTPKTVAQSLDAFGQRVTKAGGAAPSNGQPAHVAQTNKADDTPQPTVRERIAAWISGRNDTANATAVAEEPTKPEDAKPAKPEDEDDLQARAQEAAGPQIAPYQPAPSHSGVVNKGGKVYFTRYGRTFDASGNMVG